MKVKYLLATFIQAFVFIFPVVLFNAIKYKVFAEIEIMTYSFIFLALTAILSLAILSQFKFKPYVLIIALILVFLQPISLQLGYSLLIITGSQLLDKFVFNKIRKYYKEKVYEQAGRTVVHTNNLE